MIWPVPLVHIMPPPPDLVLMPKDVSVQAWLMRCIVRSGNSDIVHISLCENEWMQLSEYSLFLVKKKPNWFIWWLICRRGFLDIIWRMLDWPFFYFLNWTWMASNRSLEQWDRSLLSKWNTLCKSMPLQVWWGESVEVVAYVVVSSTSHSIKFPKSLSCIVIGYFSILLLFKLIYFICS